MKEAAKILSLAVLTGVGPLIGCARDQWVMMISTDGRVPQFGDRVLVEILDDTGKPACPGCSHLIGADDPRQWPISFGIMQAESDGAVPLHVRARLFRYDHVSNESGQPHAFLDRVVKLPPLSGRGIEYRHLHLGMSCFGVRSQVEQAPFSSCDPGSGSMTEESNAELIAKDALLPLPDSWSLGHSTDCKGQPPPGMVCVPGGAFVLGGTHFNPLGGELRPEPERLVVLRSFFMDVREFTVQDLYELRHRPGLPALPDPTSSKVLPLCLASNTPDDKDNFYPLNCITRDNAAKICIAQGKRLPREAEWEFAAGNGHEETVYPWGNADARDVCKHAVVARGYLFPEQDFGLTTWTTCRVREDGELIPSGVSPVCSDAVKKVWPDCEQVHLSEFNLLGIQDLAGNLTEWVADDFAAYGAPCWQPSQQGPQWLDNPECRVMPASPRRAARGGSWWYIETAAQVASRAVFSRDVVIASGVELQGHFGVGFRCVKDP